MVARSPPKQLRLKPLNPILLRETINKVDKCMARLQELQHTVSGGATNRGSSFKTSLRSTKNVNNNNISRGKLGSPGKFAFPAEEWRRMSLPAMLLGETIGEILEASQLAKNIVEAVTQTNKPPSITNDDEPKTPPLLTRGENKSHLLQPPPRKQEKEAIRSEEEETLSSLRRPKSKSRRINFTPQNKSDKENFRYATGASRVSPRNRPWARKTTVLFPNPLFHSSSSSHGVSNVNTKQIPHKFLIKSPHPTGAAATTATTTAAAKSGSLSRRFQVTPTRPRPMTKNSPPKHRRRSFSPSRIASRLLASPFRSSNEASAQLKTKRV